MTDGLKDERLWQMARTHNVAQFVSISNGSAPRVRFSHVRQADFVGRDDIAQVLRELLLAWGGSANVRSFLPDQEQGNPFYYGVTNEADLWSIVEELSLSGYFVIVNETIDVKDGGVSGVLHGNVIEFSPGDTPRAVEKPGVLTVKKDWGNRLIEAVYGFQPDIPQRLNQRTEFSVHPKRVGFERTHTLVWETGDQSNPPMTLPVPVWPNNFSRLVGDKVFGLLLADIAGLPVPRATVICRDIPPFEFGRATGTGEHWIRTSPREKQPGRFTTSYLWRDPFALLASEDAEENQIASVLAQEGVDAEFSGATAHEGGAVIVQGVRGHGDEFMLGKVGPVALPAVVQRDVLNAISSAEQALGVSVDIEWVHDGRRVWVVQMSVDRSSRHHSVLIPGSPARGWLQFNPDEGLDALRQLIPAAKEQNKGISITKVVGLTSHVGELIRGSGIPARYVTTPSADDPDGT